MAKIMIVDDDPQVITLLKRYLSVEGHEVIATTHSSKAIILANDEHPDLFILDLMMPPPDGFTVRQHLLARMTTLPSHLISMNSLFGYQPC